MTATRSNRILVTGATGLLGSSLVPALRAAGHEVITHGLRGAADVNFDLSDRQVTLSNLDRILPATMINLVALTSVEKCQSDPQLAYLLNVRSTENLAAWRANAPDTFLIQLSTDQVYDGRGAQKEDQVRLTNVYAFSKYASELVALHARGAVLRTNFFGRSAVPGRSSLSDWVLQNLANQVSISLFEDIYFSPLSLSTLSGMITRVAEKRSPGLFNLGSREGMSKCGFGLALAKAFDLQTTTVTKTESRFEIYRPKDMRMDSTSFENTFGVRLPSLQDEIDKLADERSTSV